VAVVVINLRAAQFLLPAVCRNPSHLDSGGSAIKAWGHKAFRFVCGIEEHPKDEPEPEVVFPAMKQSKKAKTLLTVGLTFILCTGCFLYIFWSVF